MVGRVVGDVAVAVGLLQAADAVLQPRGAGDRPGAGEGVAVAQVGPELVAVREFGRRGESGSTSGQLGRRPGCRHGSEPLATEPSESRITGVRYVTAMRAASSAASKQSPGERGARIGSGASPLRPNIACSRSACSVLVGRPVDGPPRCTSMTRSGSSVMTASPIVSLFSEKPGPEVVVTPSAPPNAAPSAAPTPAISSSAWNVVTPKRLVLAQLVQDVAGRRDRVGAEEHRQPGLDAARRPARRPGRCCR